MVGISEPRAQARGHPQRTVPPGLRPVLTTVRRRCCHGPIRTRPDLRRLTRHSGSIYHLSVGRCGALRAVRGSDLGAQGGYRVASGVDKIGRTGGILRSGADQGVRLGRFGGCVSIRMVKTAGARRFRRTGIIACRIREFVR